VRFALSLSCVALALAVSGGGDVAAAPRRPAASRAAGTGRAKAKPPRRPAVAAPRRAPAPHPAPAAPEVLFTFDDGPDLVRTPKVLDTLAVHHIKAVFFVNGVHFQGNSAGAEKARGLLREELARGHYVGNHTVHHKFLCGQLGPRIADDEILKNAELIEQAVGARPELYRTPYGAHCKTLSATLSRLGIRHTGWDIDPQDWKVKNTEIVRDRVIGALRNLRGRAILLMHDVHDDTVQALPQILDWLEKENQARVQRGEVPIHILDYDYLLPPRPVFPPLLEQIGRGLLGALPTATRAWHWFSQWLGPRWT
jgi:peptidoglycan/xylan/chitin deacetylase (PgdA/CDA1 family)